MSFVSENVTSFPNITLVFLNISNPVPQNMTSEDPIVCTWNPPAIEWFKIAMTTFGFLGNGFTFFIIVLKKELHSKTFAVIAVIALSDCLYCMGTVVWGLSYNAYINKKDYRNYKVCVDKVLYDFINIYLSGLMSAAYIASGFFIAVLSVVRYIIISYPLKSNILLTRRRVTLTISAVFIVSLGIGVLKNQETNLGAKVNKPLEFLISYLSPLSVMVIFHTLKLTTLKRNTFQKTSSSVRKMEMVVVMVVLAFFLFLLPWHVLAMLHAFDLYNPPYVAMTVSSLLLQLNNCINPVFYAFLSPRVRQYLCFCWKRTKPRNRNQTTTQFSSVPMSSNFSNIQTTTLNSFQPKT
ncbi:C-C chemokine receptor type 5-like [Ostrea edulis]|uniref:C-C chemokine receptor type 5-like n=1 Tax=Ostrea edulis TaxID=37623 RepID=UPI0024AEF32A|nr:C-C chemokine receptor type 5-like [Ostrea edulis]